MSHTSSSAMIAAAVTGTAFAHERTSLPATSRDVLTGEHVGHIELPKVEQSAANGARIDVQLSKSDLESQEDSDPMDEGYRDVDEVEEAE